MIFRDIRLRRLLEDVAFPAPKPGVNSRSCSYLRMVLADKSKSALFATFPKSGWNWTASVMNYTLYKTHRGEYDIQLHEGRGNLADRLEKPFTFAWPADSRARNAVPLRKLFDGLDLDYVFHTHGEWKESPLWRLDDARAVFLVRDPATTLFSFFTTKSQIKSFASFEAFLEDDHLDRLIRFYESWGRFRRETPPTQWLIVKYEDLLNAPNEHFGKVYEFIVGARPDPNVLREAVDFFSFKNQKFREFSLNEDESTHSIFEGRKSYDDRIRPETLDMIRNRWRTEVSDPLGYPLGKCPAQLSAKSLVLC